ncbi:adenylate cyclase [Phyllobacterium brassicacearum]|uniref:Adenylate cyclase n=2 Tax=Phyllobacterium brassicacearum TaxID=314235 RepID=A0A2P7B4U1_9HYPH|nr:adenylate cyclase [Phyllobacterium brassicacearum]
MPVQPSAADERQWTRDIRSASLRGAVLLILFANLILGNDHDNIVVHVTVVIGYLAVSLLSLGMAIARRGPRWADTFFVSVDALLVIIVLYEHLFRIDVTQEHGLTTPSLAIAFLLLNHVGLRLMPSLVALFGGIVLAGWVFLLLLMTVLHWSSGIDTHFVTSFSEDLGLAAAFTFAAVVVYLLTSDHRTIMRAAIESEERRMNLSRFFSPSVVSDLQAASDTLDLERREAVVMFVDLREFTRFTETAPALELAEILAEYRGIVAGAVFRTGGTVDKFIGDGIMAVFGQPKPLPDDADRALKCALHLVRVLEDWTEWRRREGKPALDAGIGLHVGTIVGGVLESGFHDEFTVFGDVVNVAQRLEAMTKTLDASLVVSAAMLDRVPASLSAADWITKDTVELPGRRGTIGIAYIERGVAQPIRNLA